MGLDLTLIPLYEKNAHFSSDVIKCERDSDLFEEIQHMEKSYGVLINDDGINTFLGRDENDGNIYGKTTETPYGEKIKYLKAHLLHDIFQEQKFDYWRNKAIQAFLKELPNDLPILLYWH